MRRLRSGEHFREFLKLSVTLEILVSDCANFCAAGLHYICTSGSGRARLGGSQQSEFEALSPYAKLNGAGLGGINNALRDPGVRAFFTTIAEKARIGLRTD